MSMKNLLAIGFILAVSLTAYCRPARRMPFTYTQPDGTEITLRTVGDENFHYVYEASTGRPVVKQGATYRYAELDAYGTVCPGKTASGDRETPHDISASLRVIHAMKTAKANTAATAQWGAAQANFGLSASINGVPKNFVLKGDVPCLVVLAQFADRKFTYGTEDIAKRLNAEREQLNSGEHAASARSYYMEQSGGRFKPEFEVCEPVTLSMNAADYSGRETDMVMEALDALPKSIDFSRYDVNEDGAIDNIYVIYAGAWAEEEGGYIWPHNGTILTAKRYDGKIANRYSCASELDYGELMGIGTFCHEFGHVLGLADLYTTADNFPEPADSWTPTYWDLMDTGCDLNYGTTPPNLSVFERYALGWTEPYELQGNEYIYLRAIGSDGRGAMIRNPQNANEVFFFEYRDKTGRDAYHSGEGLLVWHVQFDADSWNSNSVNNSPSNPLVKLVAADGSNGFSDYYAAYFGYDSSLAGDVFPGTAGITEFGENTNPAFLTHSGSAVTLSGGGKATLTEIGEKSISDEKYATFSLGGVPDTDEYRVVIGNEPSGIDEAFADGLRFSVEATGLNIKVTAAVRERVELVDLTGRRVTHGFTDAAGQLTLTADGAGIYILRCGSHAIKLAIK